MSFPGQCTAVPCAKFQLEFSASSLSLAEISVVFPGDFAAGMASRFLLVGALHFVQYTCNYRIVETLLLGSVTTLKAES